MNSVASYIPYKICIIEVHIMKKSCNFRKKIQIFYNDTPLAITLGPFELKAMVGFCINIITGFSH